MHGSLGQESGINETYRESSLQFILDDLTQKYNLNFSYSPSVLPINKVITVTFTQLSPEMALKKIGEVAGFKASFRSGKYILIPDKRNPKNYILQGYVKDINSGEILIGATIKISGSSIGTISNEYGYYSLQIPAGEHVMEFSFIGMATAQYPIKVETDRRLDVELTPSSSLLDEVIISPNDSLLEIDNLIKNAQIISNREMSLNTTAGGETDVIKSLNSLPGIQLFRDGSSFFNVRGGDRDQNQILIDDAPIYNPSHFFGLYSSIIPEATKDVKVYRGDLPVKYGGRISSVIDIRTRDGNLKDYSTEGSLGLISGRLLVEGPIKEDKSSFFVSGRRSYIGEILRNNVQDLDEMYFSDLNIKLNSYINQDNRIYVTGYSGRDKISFTGQNGMGWSNTAGSLRWNHIFNSKLFSNTTFYASRYDYELSGEPDIRWRNHIANASLKTDLTFLVNNNNTINYGFRISGHNFNPGNLEDSTGNIPEGYPFISKKNAIETAIYLGHDINISDRLNLIYGLRVSNWSNHGRSIEYAFSENHEVIDTTIYRDRDQYYEHNTVEPRFSLTYLTGNRSLLKFNYTRSAQYINLISNSISPFNNLEVWLPASPNIAPQRSHQFSLGWHWFNNKWAFSSESYFKSLENQIDYVNQAQLLLNPTLEGELRSGSGVVYGFESSLVKKSGKLTGRFSYSYSRSFKKVDEINDGKPYPTLWDRPHQLFFNFIYSKNGKTTFSGTVYASSGAAISTPTSYYTILDRSVPYYGERNNSRLPPYYRFDIGASFRLNKRPDNFYQHFLKISVFNLLNHKNAVFYNFNKIVDENGNFVIPTNVTTETDISSTQVYIFSLIPSITYTFKI